MKRNDDWKKLPLWQHQREAVEMARGYITDSTKGSALVRMPTGTGKTGVIAVLARCFTDTSNVLVLTPRDALRNQLADDIRMRFWRKANIDVSQWPKTVEKLFPKNVDSLLEKAKSSPFVLVATIQGLQQIYAVSGSYYERLKANVSLVLVDEGHREPAPEWAQSVRDLKKKTILFTATPYRNDHKVFNVNPDNVFAFTHQNAVADRYIREVQFRNLQFGQSSEGFVDSLLSYYDGDFKKQKPSSVDRPKVIVRCETSADVNKVATLLKKKSRSVKAFYDTFPSGKNDYRFNKVVKPEECPEEFWVHQYKLIEGIDDPSFCLLAIYQPFRNARILVQQVGRIIRNPDRKSGQVAVVLTDPTHHQERFWNGYRKFESTFEENPDMAERRQLFQLTVDIQPQTQYFEGTYRDKFDIESAKLHKEFRYPLRTTVLKIKSGFQQRRLENSIREDWLKADLDIRTMESPDPKTRVFVYVILRNSPLLIEHSLVQFEIGLTIFHRNANLLFFYDTFGNVPSYLLENTSRISPTSLQLLFGGENARLTQVSLTNTDLGRQSIRQRTFRAYSVGETAPGLADHANFCSTAQGYTSIAQGGTRRRYVGFSRSKITDPTSIQYEFDDYVKWLDFLAKILKDSRQEPLTLFERFAAYAGVPDNPTAKNVLLDVYNVMDLFELTEPGGGESSVLLEIDDVCCDVSEGKFKLIANSKPFEVGITFDRGRKKYNLSSKELEKAYIRRRGADNVAARNLIVYLNQNQAFRVIPESSHTIYAHSHFYEPRLPLSGRVRSDRFDLLKLFVPIRTLSSVTTEKGAPGSAHSTGWETNSLFQLIDDLGKGTALAAYLSGASILICDDMGNEIADFIAVDQRQKRVIFIHAKAFDTPRPRSATALHEVTSQAVKNLQYLHPLNSLNPPKLSSWSGKWHDGDIGRVAQRIRKGRGSPQDLWKRISDLIRDPTSTREVWIMLGQGLSLSSFDAERDKVNPAPQIVQILYSIQSTWSSVSSIGANLKVFCSP